MIDGHRKRFCNPTVAGEWLRFLCECICWLSGYSWGIASGLEDLTSSAAESKIRTMLPWRGQCLATASGELGHRSQGPGSHLDTWGHSWHPQFYQSSSSIPDLKQLPWDFLRSFHPGWSFHRCIHSIPGTFYLSYDVTHKNYWLQLHLTQAVDSQERDKGEENRGEKRKTHWGKLQGV